MERIATLEPGEMAPPLKSLFVYFFLIIMVGAIYLALRFKVFVGLPLEWDLYMDEIIFFLIPLGLVMLFFRLDVRGTLQLRRVAWSSLPLFGAAGCVLVAFQVFILALASRFVPEIVRYIDLNSYLGEESRRDPNAPPGPQAPDKGRLDIAPKEQLFDEGWRNAHDPNLARHG